jgi:hypothetical protein
MVVQYVVQVVKMKTNQTAEAVNQLEVTSELTDASNGLVTVWLNRSWCLVHSAKNSSITKTTTAAQLADVNAYHAHQF